MGQKIETKQAAKTGTNTCTSKAMPLKYIKDEDGNFVCPDCGVVKKNQNTMHYHMKKHEEQLSHVCKACKKGFLQKQTLELHMRSKHPELIKDGEEKKFKCPFDDCDFSTLTKGNCIIHCLRVHFQEEIKNILSIDGDNKTYCCKDCNQTFNSSCSFYYHCKSCMDFEKSNKFEKIREILA